MCTQGDPFKTLFVGRLSYDATEKKLQREFEEFGPVKSIHLVADKDGAPRPALTRTALQRLRLRPAATDWRAASSPLSANGGAIPPFRAELCRAAFGV